MAGTLLVIFDLDRPYGGVAAIEPFAMRSVEAQIVGRLPSRGDGLPCDAEGRPSTGN
ncbi:MAG: hypothetical protein H0T39_08075 [Actinobacteria bacterium]|nr:hypothetical protein [Actinomycetota bacterium]